MLILKSGKGKVTVVMSDAEYNNLLETIHLLKSKANANQLYESIWQTKDYILHLAYKMDE